jgi:acyl carrier protein
MEQIPIHPPKIPYLSNVTGTWITIDDLKNPHYWSDHLRQTVRFSNGIKVLLQNTNPIFVEVGPGRSLSIFTAQMQADSSLITMMKKNEKEHRYFLTALGQLWEAGGQIDWTPRYEGKRRNRVHVPTYVFDEQRYWIDAPSRSNRDQSNHTANNRALTETAATQAKKENIVQNASSYAAVEEAMIHTWKSLFGVQTIAADAHFFELAGDSLLAVQLLNIVGEQYEIQLPLRVLFEAPSLGQFSKAVWQKRKEDKPDIAPILLKRIARDQALKASVAQERFWNIWREEPFRFYQANDIMTFRIQGELDISALEKSLNALLERHETLRTSFYHKDHALYQRIHPIEKIDLLADRLDFTPFPEKLLRWSSWSEGWWSMLRKLSRQAMFQKLQAKVQSDFEHPFDLEQDHCLLKAKLYQLGEADHVLNIVLHRVTADGWSVHTFQAELLQLYQHFADELPSGLQPLPVQYADFSHWQHQIYQRENVEQRLTYWKQQLAGNPFEVALPADYTIPANRSYRCAHYFFETSSELGEKIQHFLRSQNSTMVILLLAVYQLLLHRFSKQETLAVAVPVHSRNTPDLEGIMGRVGMIVSIRSSFAPKDLRFSQLLEAVKIVLLDGNQHILPFELVLKEIFPDLLGRFMPPYRTMFNYHNIPTVGEEDMPDGLNMTPIEVRKDRLDCDLSLVARPNDHLLEFDFRYDPELFAEAAIKKLAAEYMHLLQVVMEDPSVQIRSIEGEFHANKNRPH